MEEFTLAWYEYILFGVVLVASLGIGVFYGFFDKTNKTNEEFLLGGRSMRILPVTLSLICTFISALSLLGHPIEIYFYGTQFSMVAIGWIPTSLVLAYIYVPVFFELQLNSAFQYFEWRFSRRLGILLSICSLTQLLFFMPTTIWGPALALEQVAGINAKWSAGFIFSVCILYSSIGGFKAVVWSDALQSLVMYGSLLAAMVIGIADIGGVTEMWEAASATHRIEWFNMDLDLRTRYTFWTGVVGLPILWVSIFAGTQAQIQRYNAVPTLSDARKCAIFNMFGLLASVSLCTAIGLLMYAKFALCDPVSSKSVTSPDQLVPFFVMRVLKDWPGMPGLFFAGITCASLRYFLVAPDLLCTVSSSLNASAAIVEMYIKQYRPNLTEIQLAYIAKIVSTISGLIGFGLVFLIAGINESIQVMPFAAVLTACTVGPIFGAFTLGMFFPWVNDLGTQLGILISVPLSCFIMVGNIVAGSQKLLPNQRRYLSVEGCANNATSLSYATTLMLDGSEWKAKAENDAWLLKLWSMSYAWQAAFTIFSTIILGLVFSCVVLLFNSKAGMKVNRRLLSKPILRFWTTLFGQRFINNWVEVDRVLELSGINLTVTPKI